MAICKDCFHWEACRAMFEAAGGIIVPDDFKGSAIWCKHFVSTADVAPKSQWISVDERLPDKEGVYLVYTYRGHMKMSKYSGWGVDDEASFDDFFVTHWMPLPEPPVMKGGAE